VDDARTGLLTHSRRRANIAVVAHVRHVETNYDQLLGGGVERHEARAAVADAVEQVLAQWSESRDTRP
jgi:hypothetical protein